MIRAGMGVDQDPTGGVAGEWLVTEGVRHAFGEDSGAVLDEVSLRVERGDKEVLLLDEPFIWHELGLTILLIAHDPEEAVFLSDRTYVLSPRPGKVSDVVAIDLPRPQRPDVVRSPDFAAL